MSSLQQPFVSDVANSFRSLICVLYTVSCNISHILISTGFKSGQLGGHSCSGINSALSFGNNSVVALVRWAFQVLHGSVETLFRWVRWKTFNRFVANLFRKRCTKFRPHHLSFVGDITNNILVFFPEHSVIWFSWCDTLV